MDEALDCWDNYPMEHGCICGNECEPPSWHDAKPVPTPEHDHGPRVIACVGCGEERWCGIGECRRCGAVTPCPANAMPALDTKDGE